MLQIIRIGMETSKSVFQLHGVNAAEQPVLRKKMRRKEMVDFFTTCPSTVIAIEACGASHYWARLLTWLGHEVRLIAPQLAKPYVKHGKNDAADAEALCEAMSRPTMRFVPAKSARQQAALMLVGMRERAVAAQTALANTIRGYAAEFGLTMAKGMSHIPLLLERVMMDDAIPDLARDLFASLAAEFAQANERMKEVNARLMAWYRNNECCGRPFPCNQSTDQRFAINAIRFRSAMSARHGKRYSFYDVTLDPSCLAQHSSQPEAIQPGLLNHHHWVKRVLSPFGLLAKLAKTREQAGDAPPVMV